MSEQKAASIGSWSRRGVLSAAAVAGASTLTTGGLTGCSGGSSGGAADKVKEEVDNPSDNLKKKGFPIVKKPVTLHFMTGKGPINSKDYNKVASWKRYQKLTKVKIDWGLVPQDDVGKKRNLVLGGGDYPEGFHTTGMGSRDVGKYGSQGVLVKLNDLIDDYMPNLKKVMDDYKEIRRGMTFPDGSVYALPHTLDPKFTERLIQIKLWVRGDWLDKFDMDVPKTTTEYYRYLKAVKRKKPNGKDPSIGYCDRTSANYLYDFLSGAFGVSNRGTSQGYIDAEPDDDDKVRFYPITDGYKALLEYVHHLYSEGLIAKNIFSIDASKVQSAGAKGTYGSTTEASAAAFIGGKSKKMVPVPALKGPDGDHALNNIVSPLYVLGAFVMTDKMKHPIEAARWLDYFYSDEGSKLMHMGVQDVSYKSTKNGPEYLNKITDDPDGATMEEALKPYVTYMGGGYPGMVKKGYFKGVVTADDAVQAAKLLRPDMLKEVWSGFTFTQKEAEKLDSVADDIEKYVDESRDKFVNGDLRLSDWDRYVKKIKQMGLEDYLEIQQAAYDRYQKA